MNDNASVPNHRLSRRRPAKGGVRVACHRGGLYLGPNLALGVLDLSETGARLLLKESLEPGREVSLRVEGRANLRPVRRLADVAWSVPLADGTHCAGMRFQKHLTYREVSELGRETSGAPGAGPAAAPPASPAPGGGPRVPSAAERRRSERHPADHLLSCRVSACEKGGPDFTATVLDLSATGVGLLAPHRPTAGVVVALRFAARDASAGRDILANLAYAAELAAGGFLLGAQFLQPLTEAECQAILAPAGRPGRATAPPAAEGDGLTAASAEGGDA